MNLKTNTKIILWVLLVWLLTIWSFLMLNNPVVDDISGISQQEKTAGAIRADIFETVDGVIPSGLKLYAVANDGEIGTTGKLKIYANAHNIEPIDNLHFQLDFDPSVVNFTGSVGKLFNSTGINSAVFYQVGATDWSDPSAGTLIVGMGLGGQITSSSTNNKVEICEIEFDVIGSLSDTTSFVLSNISTTLTNDLAYSTADGSLTVIEILGADVSLLNSSLNAYRGDTINLEIKVDNNDARINPSDNNNIKNIVVKSGSLTNTVAVCYDEVSCGNSKTMTLNHSLEIKDIVTVGNHILEISSENMRGGVTTESFTINVLNEPPKAVIDFINQDYYIGDTISFNGSGSSDGDGTITSFNWNLGGDLKSGETVNHVFTGSGDKAISLEVVDNDGGNDDENDNIYIRTAPNLVSIDINGMTFNDGASLNLGAGSHILELVINDLDASTGEISFVSDNFTGGLNISEVVLPATISNVGGQSDVNAQGLAVNTNDQGSFDLTITYKNGTREDTLVVTINILEDLAVQNTTLPDTVVATSFNEDLLINRTGGFIFTGTTLVSCQSTGFNPATYDNPTRNYDIGLNLSASGSLIGNLNKVGQWCLGVEIGNGLESISAEINITIDSTIKGIIKDEDGNILEDVFVNIVSGPNQLTLVDGIFEFTPLATGTHTVSFTKNGYVDEVTDVIINDGDSDIKDLGDIILIREKKDITFIVTDSLGNSINNPVIAFTGSSLLGQDYSTLNCVYTAGNCVITDVWFGNSNNTLNYQVTVSDAYQVYEKSLIVETGVNTENVVINPAAVILKTQIKDNSNDLSNADINIINKANGNIVATGKQLTGITDISGLEVETAYEIEVIYDQYYKFTADLTLGLGEMNASSQLIADLATPLSSIDSNYSTTDYLFDNSITYGDILVITLKEVDTGNVIIYNKNGILGSLNLTDGLLEIILDLLDGVDLSQGLIGASGVGNCFLEIDGQLKDICSFQQKIGDSLHNLQVGITIGDKIIAITKGVKLFSGISGQSSQFTDNNDGVEIILPDGTIILAENSWDWILGINKTTDDTITNLPTGFIQVGDNFYTLGNGTSSILFDQAVTLVLRGQTDQPIFKMAGGTAWQEISQCTGTFATPDEPVFPGECYITDGTDLKIVTFHLTNFAFAAPVANTKPVANSINVTTNQNTSKSFVLTGSDTDGDSLTFSLVTTPSSGSLSGTVPNLTYAPNSGFTGSDSFTFKVNDGTVDSDVATVSISINAVSSGGGGGWGWGGGSYTSYLKTVKKVLEKSENIWYNPANIGDKEEYYLTNEDGKIYLYSEDKDAKITIFKSTLAKYSSWSGLLKAPYRTYLTEKYKGYPVIEGWKFLNKGVVFSPEFTFTLNDFAGDKNQALKVFYGDDINNLKVLDSSKIVWNEDDELVLTMATGRYCFITENNRVGSVVSTDDLDVYLLDSDAAGHWAIEYIKKFITDGVIKKTKTIRPNEYITRGEAVKITMGIYNHAVNDLNESEKNILEAKFKDVARNSWAAKFIWYAHQKGISNGYDGNIFKPDNYLTRMEALKILFIANSNFNIDYFDTPLTPIEEQELLNQFTDLYAGQWYLTYLHQAYKKNVMNGYTEDNRQILKPADKITRAEFMKIASLIALEENPLRYLAIETKEEPKQETPVIDQESGTSEWNKLDYRQKLQKLGVAQFDLNDNLTKDTVVESLNNLSNNLGLGKAIEATVSSQKVNKVELLALASKLMNVDLGSNRGTAASAFQDISSEDWYEALVGYFWNEVYAHFSFDKQFWSVDEVKLSQETQEIGAYHFNRNLNLGKTGEDVRELQRLLKELGHYEAGINGVYEKYTMEAVAKYQESLFYQGRYFKERAIAWYQPWAGVFGEKARQALEEDFFGRTPATQADEVVKMFNPDELITGDEFYYVVYKLFEDKIDEVGEIIVLEE